jgi:hypothetical protein
MSDTDVLASRDSLHLRFSRHSLDPSPLLALLPGGITTTTPITDLVMNQRHIRGWRGDYAVGQFTGMRPGTFSETFYNCASNIKSVTLPLDVMHYAASSSYCSKTCTLMGRYLSANICIGIYATDIQASWCIKLAARTTDPRHNTRKPLFAVYPHTKHYKQYFPNYPS